MPAPRGSERLSDAVDLHGEAVQQTIETIHAVLADGKVDGDEPRLVRVTLLHLFQTYQPLPSRAAAQDDAFRLIGAAAGAAAISDWVKRIACEGAADRAA